LAHFPRRCYRNGDGAGCRRAAQGRFACVRSRRR
jgi:hypothetical protein